MKHQKLKEAIEFAKSHGLSVFIIELFNGEVSVDIFKGHQTLYSRIYSRGNRLAQAEFIKRSAGAYIAKLRTSQNYVAPHRRMMYKLSGEEVSSHAEGLMGTKDGYTWFLTGGQGYVWFPEIREWVTCAVNLSDFLHMDRVCRAWVKKSKMYHC